MTNGWSAIACPSVREGELRAALEGEGVEWDKAAHVTATGSLARGIRRTETAAVAIAQLIDVLVWSGFDGRDRMDVTAFPTPDLLPGSNGSRYDDALKTWNNELNGRRVRHGLHADVQIRRFLSTGASNRDAAQVLRRGVRELRRTVQELVAAGFEAHEIRPSTPLGAVAVEAWKHLESTASAVSAVRDDLWFDLDGFERQDTEAARNLRSRLTAMLNQLFGEVTERRTIVYHGFYFFTPPQWRFFQLIRQLPGVDQLFIVHDDGQGRAFETWRRFFVERWAMPQPAQKTTERQGSPADELSRALGGQHVNATSLDQRLTLLHCQTPADFVRTWQEQLSKAHVDNDTRPELYAPQHKDIDRLISRLSLDPADRRVDLADLPVGQFLLAVHDCIELVPGSERRFVLAADRFIDMAASGLLDASDPKRGPAGHVASFRRVMPFFRGCDLLDDWIVRAEALHRLVIDEVDALGPRSPDQPDLERIAVAAGNPLRLVPWCDITDLESEVLLTTMKSIRDLVQQVADFESRNITEYIDWVRSQLQNRMESLPPEMQAEITDKLRGASLGSDVELDAEGILEVVRILLGRQADFDSTGEEDEGDDERRSVKGLRGLDVLGLTPAKGDVHLTNLIEGAFPTRVTMVGWPFADHELLEGNDELPAVAVEIMRTRSETAALSDLYLFWLTLDGVSEGRHLRLSWISDIAGEIRNPSPIAMLIARPNIRSDDVLRLAGGVEVKRATAASSGTSTCDRPESRPWTRDNDAIASAVVGIEPRAAAAALACPRRFALQWAVGPTASFAPEHTQAMLFGNLQGLLKRSNLMSDAAAVRLTKDLWRHVTRGERRSSYFKRRISPGGADPTWIFTLGGGKTRHDAISEAYRAARESAPPDPEAIASGGRQFLPVPDQSQKNICVGCPVNARCAVRFDFQSN